MAISQKKCVVCGTEFYGQKNAMYCSVNCKQKAYRNRNKPIYTCAVNGNLGRSGKYLAMCGRIGVNTNICRAEGKCEHKVKQEIKS